MRRTLVEMNLLHRIMKLVIFGFDSYRPNVSCPLMPRITFGKWAPLVLVVLARLVFVVLRWVCVLRVFLFCLVTIGHFHFVGHSLFALGTFVFLYNALLYHPFQHLNISLGNPL